MLTERAAAAAWPALPVANCLVCVSGQALRSMADALFKGVSPLDQRALEQLQAAGQSVLPNDEEAAEFTERELALRENPPSPDQLLAHLEFLPHPQPWSPHNVAAFCQCLTSMGIDTTQADKIRVTVSRTQTRGRRGSTWRLPDWLCVLVACVGVFESHSGSPCGQAECSVWVVRANAESRRVDREGGRKIRGGEAQWRCALRAARDRWLLVGPHACLCVSLCRLSQM